MDSTVISDYFEQLAQQDSIAYDKANKYGPFDIVNIDLCGSISHNPPKPYFDAILNLINMQEGGFTFGAFDVTMYIQNYAVTTTNYTWINAGTGNTRTIFGGMSLLYMDT